LIDLTVLREEECMSAENAREAWVALPSEEEIRAIPNRTPHPYESFLGGTIARMSRLLMAHDVIGPAFAQLSRTVLFGPGVLSRSERELVAAVTSAAQRCRY
jgi:hypothetical protein